MSFSGEVKEELLKIVPSGKTEGCAELAAIFMFCARTLSENAETITFSLHIENQFVSQKVFTLLKKTFKISMSYDKVGELSLNKNVFQSIDYRNASVCESLNGKRAFLRGAYLCSGSMSDPKGSYHLEFTCDTQEKAAHLQSLMGAFGIEARQVERKKYYVVYIKDGSAIGDLLNIIGAHVSLMNFENFRILKEMRNSINRKVNCEAANIAKTVSAANKQVQDIQLIEETIGFGDLSQSLSEMARLRLEYPDATLQELGDLLEPPVSKSGVNHRLKKLSEIAERIRVQ